MPQSPPSSNPGLNLLSDSVNEMVWISDRGALEPAHDAFFHHALFMGGKTVPVLSPCNFVVYINRFHR